MKLPAKLLLLTALFFSSLVCALSTDKGAPLNIEADQVEMREREGTSIYTGHVKITKGSLKITGSKITIKSKDGELHLIEIQGTPATFFQLNDLGEEVSAQSHQMEYLANSGLLELKENALLLKNQNRFSSQHIIYDTQKDIVKAGNNNEPSVDNQQPPRVKITINPKKTTTPDQSPQITEPANKVSQ